MASKDRTKIIFAEALVKLSKTKPLSEITINEITAACQMTRNSFYYYFHDKQSLIIWIYLNFRKTLVLEPSKENMKKFASYLKENATFFKQAFHQNVQNNFRAELLNVMTEDFLSIIDDLLKDPSLVKEDCKQFIARFYAGAAVSMYEELLNNPPNNLEYTLELFSDLLRNGVLNAINNDMK